MFFVNSCTRTELWANATLSATQAARRKIKLFGDDGDDDDERYVNDHIEQNDKLLIACVLWKLQHLGQASIWPPIHV